MSYTNRYQKHEPSSFCYYIKCFDDKVYKPKLVSYTGEDAAQKFVNMLEKDIREITSIPDKKMIFGEEELKRFNKETTCWICGEKFIKGDFKNRKVRDHCHFTGRYRGAAHKICNLLYKKPNFTPVVFHNLSGYDGHLFIKNLGRTDRTIDCIPNNEEKYISFTKRIHVGTYSKKVKNEEEDEEEEDEEEEDKKKKTKYEIKRIYHSIRFIDNFKFMATSLEKIVNNLCKESFDNVRRYYEENELNLLSRKGVYPYEYMDSPEKLNERQLPAKVAFYSKLNEEGISDKDYEHAKTVWKTIRMKTMRDYHGLYNQADVLLLADVFENFRNVCSRNYNLDPAHYFTAPGLAWDAALKLPE